MALGHGSSIVRNDLVLHLDAANAKSYPGSGTTWMDLSGNGNNGTLINGVGYNNSNRGSLVFDGVDDYVSVSLNQTYLEYTFSFFCKWITLTAATSRVFGISNYGTYTIFNPSNVGYHYNQAPGSTTILSSNVNVGLGNWCHITVSESRFLSSAKIYINGIRRANTSVISTSGFYGNVSIGAQWKTPPNNINGNCEIPNFSLYNRVLTDIEIQQNFEALRGRYGI
jgi:hypothetical protein